MTHEETPAGRVGQIARTTFEAIKTLRKTHPKRTKQEREQLDAAIKVLHDEWWKQTAHLFTKSET